MNISAYTQSFSLSLTYSTLHLTVQQGNALLPAASPGVQAPSAGVDTVALSPEATAQEPATGVETAPGPDAQTPVTEAPAPEAPPVEAPTSAPAPPPSRAAARAEALLSALDADGDGAITKEEFTEGAMTLLRRAGARHHHGRTHGERAEHDDRGGHGSHRTGRLEAKLERLFDRLDASADGGVDQAELTAALAQVTRERRHENAETPAEPTSATQPTPAPQTPEPPTPTPPATSATFSYTSVTVVVAVQQYAAVAGMR